MTVEDLMEDPNFRGMLELRKAMKQAYEKNKHLFDDEAYEDYE